MSLNFRKARPEEPEINLIPFIDVLLVILIFLMLSTTYSKFTELQVTLPIADAEKSRDRPNEIIVSVSADGRFAIRKISASSIAAAALQRSCISALMDCAARLLALLVRWV